MLPSSPLAQPFQDRSLPFSGQGWFRAPGCHTSRECPDWGKEGQGLREAGWFSSHESKNSSLCEGWGGAQSAFPVGGGCSKGAQVSQGPSRPRPEQRAIPSAWVEGPSWGTAGPGRKRRGGGTDREQSWAGYPTPGLEEPPSPPLQAPDQERRVRVTQRIKRHLFTVPTQPQCPAG